MKSVLLTIVGVVLLLHQMNGCDLQRGSVSSPCQTSWPPSRYSNFVNRHILRESFDRGDKTEWASYLEEMNLCARTKVQSFIDEDEGQVKQVCRGGGQRVAADGNLCISKSDMRVYDVSSRGTNQDCTVTKVILGRHKVVLACDKVNNNCVPIHYQDWRGYQAVNLNCS